MALVCIISFVVLGIVPVYAAEITLVFDGWSKYQDAISYEVTYGMNLVDRVQTNVVTVDDNNVTHIVQDVKLFELIPAPEYVSTLQTVAISVPSDALSLLHYIPTIYSGKEATFILIMKVHYAFVLAYDYEFSAQNGVLYVSLNTSDVISCRLTDSKILEFNDNSHLTFQCTFSVKIPHETFISGFWFKFSPNLTYRPMSVEDGNGPLVRLETWISPIVLSDSVTASQMADSVAQGILSGTGGNKYNPPDTSASEDLHAQEEAMMNQVEDLFNQSNIPFNLDLNSYPELTNSMLGFSSAFEQIFTGLPFVKPLIMFSLGLGAFGFLFGLAQHGFTTNARVDAARARRNKGKGD